LNSAKSILGKGEGLTEARESLMNYLSLEDKVALLNDLEAYLIYQGSIEEELGSDFEDLDRLSFQLLLYFKQNRYRDIVRMGDLLKQSFMVVPEAQREKYVEILQIIGDAYHRVNQLYDSSEFYAKALEVDPNNLQTLLRARQNYERLNEDVKVLEISAIIEELLSPSEIDLSTEPPIRKREEYSRSVILEGQDIILHLQFQKDWDDRPPLVFIEFNGNVVLEEYLDYENVSLPLNSYIGENVVRVRAINRPITLLRLQYEPWTH
jgi:tetratricopeptide (TPR) repeat protein